MTSTTAAFYADLDELANLDEGPPVDETDVTVDCESKLATVDAPLTVSVADAFAEAYRSHRAAREARAALVAPHRYASGEVVV